MEPVTQDDIELVHLRRLAASLDSMRHDTAMTDIILMCEEREFPAHRLILAAGSPYFQSMLRSEWKDSNCERCHLPGWSGDIIAAILSFMYTGQLMDKTLTSDKEAMTNLLVAGDYFQIEDLIEYCFKTISDLSLTISSFREMYTLADKFSNKSQVSRIEKLLSPNFSEMSQSEDFLQLSKSQLQGILQHSDVNRSGMDEVFNAVLKWTEYDSNRCAFLKELMNALSLYWCPVYLNDLVLLNISNKVWNSATRTVLSEIHSSQRCPQACHRLMDHNLQLTCFADNKVHTYDMDTCEWLSTRKLQFYVDDKTAAVIYNRHIFFLGGQIATSFVDSRSTYVAQYCPFVNSLVDKVSDDLISSVYCAAAVVLSDSIYVINGMNMDGDYLRTVQQYNPNEGTCRKVASTIKRHAEPFAFAFEDYVYVFGVTSGFDKSLEQYDPTADQWTELLALTGIHEFKGTYHSTFIAPNIYCLNELNLEHPLHMINVLSKQREIVPYIGGPDIIVALQSIEQKGKTFLVAIDHRNAPHFYDIETQVWVTIGPSNNSSKMWHHLSCCM